MSTRVNSARKSVVGAVRRGGGHVAEMQRRRLLLAIGELVAMNGLEAATVGRVCEQAGVSRRTFYELFADREACLLGAFDAAVQRFAQSARSAYEAPVRWRDRVRAALTALLEQLDAQPDLARLCVVEAPRAGMLVLERHKRVLATLAETIDDGRSEARAGNEPPPLTAQGVVGGALSVIHARLLANPVSVGAGGTRTEKAPSERDPQSVLSGVTAAAVDGSCLVELTGPLMGMIVHPYLGASAARQELQRPAPIIPRSVPRNGGDPFKGLPIRFTYRTARVLSTIASECARGSYPSNRHIAEHAGIADEGQTSRLLARLRDSGLIENHGQGQAKGEPNAWALTHRGQTIHTTITTQTTTAP